MYSPPRRASLFLFVAVLALAGLPWAGQRVQAGAGRPADDPLVRVRLGLRGPYTLRFAQPWTLNGASMPSGSWHLQVSTAQAPVLEADDTHLRHELPLLSRLESRQGPFSLNGRRYRGSLLVKRATLVNEVGLEEYLYGVVAREMGGGAQLEALKAQAVVARTYAVAHMGRGDFADDSSFQVYQGMGNETPVSVLAVDETRGQVLAFQDQIARHVCYHSTCGGHTEDNENVFLTSPVPYLRGVPCLPGREAPGASPSPAPLGLPEASTSPAPVAGASEVPAPAPTPTGEMGAPEPSPPVVVQSPAPASPTVPLTGAFPTEGAACCGSSFSHWTIALPLPAGTPVEIVERSASGRVVRLRLGTRFLEGDEIRRALRFHDLRGRWVNLYSTAFRLTQHGNAWVAEGWGWGHGVGMCQWGARGMASAGRGYAEILGHYFPGTTLAMVSFAPSARSTAKPNRGL